MYDLGHGNFKVINILLGYVHCQYDWDTLFQCYNIGFVVVTM